jgi:hypothetical protein
VSLIERISLPVFIDDLEFLKALSGGLGLVQLTLTLAHLSVLLEDLQEVVRDEFTAVCFGAIR